MCREKDVHLTKTDNSENSRATLQPQFCCSGPEIRMESGFRLSRELWSHVASSLLGVQHENTHDFISDNNRAGVKDHITQERNVALTVQVINSRAEAGERLTPAMI